MSIMGHVVLNLTSIVQQTQCEAVLIRDTFRCSGCMQKYV